MALSTIQSLLLTQNGLLMGIPEDRLKDDPLREIPTMKTFLTCHQLPPRKMEYHSRSWQGRQRLIKSATEPFECQHDYSAER